MAITTRPTKILLHGLCSPVHSTTYQWPANDKESGNREDAKGGVKRDFHGDWHTTTTTKAVFGNKQLLVKGCRDTCKTNGNERRPEHERENVEGQGTGTAKIGKRRGAMADGKPARA